MNRVTLLGNMTRDPEARSTSSGADVCNFGVAHNRKWKAADGSVREEVTFADCEAWGKTAENIAKYLHKGDPILIDGRLRLDKWESKEGEKRSKLVVVVEAFHFVGGKKQEQTKDKEHIHARASASGPMTDEDIPF